MGLMAVSELVSLDNKNIYCAPANPAGRKLIELLNAEGIAITGLVDNLKQGAGIVNAPSQARPNSLVIVADGSFQAAVVAQMLDNGWPASHIMLFDQMQQRVSPIGLGLGHRLRQCIRKVVGALIRFTARMRFFKCDVQVYYAENFVDTNLAQLMAYHARSTERSVILVGANLGEQKLPDGITQKSARTLSGFLSLVRAPVLVIDHEYTSFVFNQLRQVIPVVQLWHGLPYKQISGNRHYPWVNDAAFISSSSWYNEEVLSGLFRAKQYLALGYPRNDVLLAPQEGHFWFASLSFAELEKFRQRSAFWVYMPTYRDGASEQLPDLELLQRVCEVCKRQLVLKLHPFVAQTVAKQFDLSGDMETLAPLPEYDRLFIYPGKCDVYPWLSYSEALITDYSSVVFDYLLLDKPIVFLHHDREQYEKVRGNSIIEDDNFLVGPVVFEEENLATVMTDVVTNTDMGNERRIALRRKLDIQQKASAPDILGLLNSMTS